MRKLLLFLIIPFIAYACKEDMKPDEIALQTAKVYYDQLLQGDASSFVAGMYFKDSVVSSYREQLETNMRMFVYQQQKLHQGIVDVRTIKASLSEDGATADAFLLFCFGDSTKEQIVVPMILVDGIWKMK